MDKIITAFISYCHENQESVEWVVKLKKNLESENMNVLRDLDEFIAGDEMSEFMNKMTDDSIDNVLVIIDEEYINKVDEKKNGVWEEIQLIDYIIKYGKKNKVIPLFKGANNKHEKYPKCLKDIWGVSFLDEKKYSEKFDILCDNMKEIKEKSSIEKSSKKIDNRNTETLKKTFADISRNLNNVTRKYLENFYTNLKNLNFEQTDQMNFESIKFCLDKNIEQYIPLRNDFIEFLSSFEEDLEIDYDIIIHFFEKLYSLYQSQDDAVIRYSYSFFIHELFIYAIATGLKNNNYIFIQKLLYSPYYLKHRFSENKYNFGTDFYAVELIRILGDHNKQIAFAEDMIKRIPETWEKDDFIDADLLIFYISRFTRNTKNSIGEWFPLTYVYKERRGHYFTFDLFNKTISKKHFEKIKILLKVEDKDELLNRLKEIIEENNESIGYTGALISITPLPELFDMGNICNFE